MKKYDLDKIILGTNVPEKISDDYRDTSKYSPLIGGYRVLKEAMSDHLIGWHVERRNKFIQLNGWAQEDIEDHIYVDTLHGLNDIKKEKINIIELGIGYAEPSLIFAGLLDNTNLFPEIKNYHIIGVDAEINHCKWSERELREQIKGKSNVLHSALSNYDGIIKYPQNCGNDEYGAYVGSGEDVQCVRLNTLVDKFKIDVIDVLHIDIQEQELNVIKDSTNLLGKINYMYIGTHTPEVHQELITILTESGLSDIILDIPHLTETDIPGFGNYVTHSWFDGIIYCKLKNLV